MSNKYNIHILNSILNMNQTYYILKKKMYKDMWITYEGFNITYYTLLVFVKNKMFYEYSINHFIHYFPCIHSNKKKKKIHSCLCSGSKIIHFCFLYNLPILIKLNSNHLLSVKKIMQFKLLIVCVICQINNTS